MDKKEIAQIKFSSTKPTKLSLTQLNHWVIWQFPKKVTDGFCGAVHPPIENYGWLPAIIRTSQNEALVDGHLSQPFKTPELAAEQCLANGRS